MQPPFGKNYFFKKTMIMLFLILFYSEVSDPKLYNHAQFKYVHTPTSRLIMICLTQISHRTWSKLCMIQILLNPNFAQYKLCIIQTLHDPNFARSKTLHDPNLFLSFTPPHFLVCCFFNHSVDFFILVRQCCFTVWNILIQALWESSWCFQLK